MLDTAKLIAFFEAELNQLDQKHRTLECELIVYGTIARVLKGVYADKVRAEAPPAPVPQEGEEKPAQGHVEASVPLKKKGSHVRPPMNITRRCLNQKCQKLFKPWARAQFTCGKADSLECARHVNALNQRFYQMRKKGQSPKSENEKEAVSFFNRRMAEVNRVGLTTKHAT